MTYVRVGRDRLAWDRVLGSSLAYVQLADSPMVHYVMQEPSGTTTTDTSGNSRNGSYSGATLAQSPIITDKDYSVTMGSIAIADAAWMDTNSWTFEVLVYATSWTSYRGLATRDNETTDRAWAVRVNAGQSNTIAWNASGTLYVANGGTTLATGTPYLIAAKWDASANLLTTFYNGTQWAQVATTGNAKAGAEGAKIAQGSTTGSYAYSGRMSHAAWYGTALTDAQIVNHARAANLY